jgi:uncharacterized iron-regulated protein
VGVPDSRLSIGLLVTALSLSACASRSKPPPQAAPAQQTRHEWSGDARVFDTRLGQEVSSSALLEALAEYEFVLVGETHLDDVTHRIELAIFDGLADRKRDEVTLALEMFQRDVQPVLDDYLASNIDEPTFSSKSRPWGNYRTGYRPLIESAKQRRTPVVAANLPIDLQRKFAMGGAQAVTELGPEERALMPAEVFPPDDAYWARLARRLRDHGHGHVVATDPAARRYAIQNLWDNSMAESAVLASTRNPEHLVLLVAGGFHVEYGQGIAAQIRRRLPGAEIATVSIAPVYDLGTSEYVPREPPVANFVIHVQERARGSEDATLAVHIPVEFRYRLNAPVPLPSTPLPLLVWLADDGADIDDALRYWQVALGDQAIIAAIEHPYPQREADGRIAGRWAWSATYAEDQTRIARGVERIVDYLSHYYGIDSARVVVSGRGAGATSALWVGLAAGIDGESGLSIVALDPTDPHRIIEAPLGEDAPGVDDVVLLGSEESIHGIAETYETAGIDDVTVQGPPDRDAARWALEHAIREALGVPPRPGPHAPTKTFAIEVDSDQARRWAELHARLAEREAGHVRVVSWPADDATVLRADPTKLTDGSGIPLAPGAFGGTTLLVLPQRLSKAERKAWRALAEDDVLAQRSRFHGLRVVEVDELAAALDALRAQGKRNVLVVPAAFAATTERMVELQSAAHGHTEGLTVHWLPGLGGALAQ